jgi:hypothetical protein
VDAYFEHKAAELTRAQSQCAHFEREYLKAQKVFDTYNQKSDFQVTVELGLLLLVAREEKSELENVVEEAQRELEEDDDEDNFFTPNSEIVDTTFPHFPVYICLGWLTLTSFVLLCAAIGW